MKTYIGVKTVKAEPEFEGHTKRLVPTPLDPLAQGRDGYKVIYPDGYESWSPKAVFEAAYRVVDDDDAPRIEGELRGECARLAAGGESLAEQIGTAYEEMERRERLDRINAEALGYAIGSFPQGVPPTTEDITNRAAAFVGFITQKDTVIVSFEDLRTATAPISTAGQTDLTDTQDELVRKGREVEAQVAELCLTLGNIGADPRRIAHAKTLFETAFMFMTKAIITGTIADVE